MNREAMVAELMQPWKDMIQETLGNVPQAESLVERMTFAAIAGRESEVMEIKAKLLLLKEQASGRASKAQERTIHAALGMLFAGIRAGLAAISAACLIALLNACMVPPGYVSAANLKPALDLVTLRHDALLDDDPSNDPMPRDQAEREGWLETSRMLRETVDLATER